MPVLVPDVRVLAHVLSLSARGLRAMGLSGLRLGADPMIWSALKLTMLDALLKWLVRRAWPVAQDIVGALAANDRLTGDDKRALARARLIAEAKALEMDLADSAANFLIECALQYLRGRFGDTGVER